MSGRGRSTPRRIGLASLLVCACKAGETPDPRVTARAEVAVTEPALAPPAVPTPNRPGPLVLPPAVPALVAGVAVVRGDGSVRTALSALDPLVGGDEHLVAMVTEVDDYLAGRFGVRVSSVDQATVFLLAGEPKVAAVLQGVDGASKLTTEPVAHVGQVALHQLQGEEVVAAVLGDTMLLGHREAVEAGLLAAQGTRTRLADSGDALVEMLTRYGEHANYAVAFATERLPDYARIPVAKQGVTHGVATLGATGVTLAARGEAGKLSTLGAQLDGLFVVGKANVAAQKEAALERDDPAEVVALIAAEHWLRRADGLLDATLQDGDLVLRLPLRAGSLAAAAPLAVTMAAIAIPAFTKYARRSKTHEARINLAALVDAASAYFEEAHVIVTVAPDGTATSSTRHLCPNDGTERGEAGLTPPLAVDCNRGPGGRCVPAADGGSAAIGEYDAALWTDNPVWKGLHFAPEAAHAFHYNFRYENFPGEYGGCQFTTQAFGDLDGDGVYSTYERIGVTDPDAPTIAAPLTVEQDVE